MIVASLIERELCEPEVDDEARNLLPDSRLMPLGSGQNSRKRTA